MRFFQYLPQLESARIQVAVSPFFRDQYQERFQKDGSKSMWEALHGYIGRTRALLTADRFDLLWIEKDPLPWVPAAIETRILPSRIPYVLDYDDAVFHQYDMHRNALVRRHLGRKHDRIMKGAALVVAGNQYIAERARNAGARLVEIVPTVVDLERYSIDSVHSVLGSSAPVVVGWIGQRHNARYLNPLGDVIERLASEGKTRFVAVGAGDGLGNLPFESLVWSEAIETQQISKFDIGIMPLPDEPFERGKCGYKLIQYMACCKPVVASPVGVNREIVEHGVNGFLAETPEEWERALRLLAQDSALRKRMGAAGRSKVEAMYSLQAIWPRLAELLRTAANR